MSGNGKPAELPGIFLACVLQEAEPVDRRRAAKNTGGVTDSQWAAVRPLAEGHFAPANLFGDKRHRALVIAGFICSCSGREMSTNVAKCIQMYTYVAPISVFLGRYYASYRTVPRRP